MKFAIKYGFQQLVNSTIYVPCEFTMADIHKKIHGVITNSVLYIDESNISSISTGEHSYVEHSVLTGQIQVGTDCIVSHIHEQIGTDLMVNSGIMMQQIPLESSSVLNEQRRAVLIVLGLKDDVKVHYKSEKASICGVTWSTLFQVFKLLKTYK
jgi:hypothetical protein